MALSYNNPSGGENSTIDGKQGKQIVTNYYLKKALIDAAKEQVFSKLSDPIVLPKNSGKAIERYAYIPLLDDRNLNDQGIDATGAVIEEGSGNLWGSSRDIGLITDKLPVLKEDGGRVNRVGFERVVRKSSLTQVGFFFEWTQSAADFDSDDQFYSHIYSEALKGAQEINEAMLQMDLLNSAGVIVYPGTATSDDEVTGEGDNATVVDYDSLARVDEILTLNRCPKQTTIVTGSTNSDTRTIPACRIAYCGPNVKRLLERLKDPFGNAAFVPVHKYAAATKPLPNEVGSINNFRFIEVADMLYWGKGSGGLDDGGSRITGAPVTNNLGYREVDGKYEIHPILIIGEDAFNCITFKASSASKNFNIITKMPGPDTASPSDPYGEIGFTSIKWYYGFLCNRPERIAILKTVAPI